jgi:flagellin
MKERSTPDRQLWARSRSPIRTPFPSMRISTNIPAIHAHQQLAEATARQATAAERLASGRRINSAADDAAGLSISEKLRARISGLGQASRNAQDAVSLLQTADGALSEVHAMLQRVRELAVQYHSGTLSSSDRDAVQAEASELRKEVMRIGEQTSFNGIPLLDRVATIPFQVGDRDGETIDVQTPSLRKLFAVGVEPGLRGFEYYAKPFDTTIDMVSRSLGPDMHTPVTTQHSYAIPANASMEDVAAIINADPDSPVEVTARYDAPNDGYAFGFYNKGDGTTFDTVASGAAIEEWDGYHDRYPGVDAYPVFDFGDPDDIAQIDGAITTISAYRGEFGAAQNRIERTVRSVLTQQENLTTAESRIRDADVAQEAVEMATAGILAQAATSMLAQANQAPQLVLSLLRN